MVYAVLLGILFGAGFFATGGIAIWGALDKGTARKCVGGILCPILFILFLCIPFSFHVVDTGEAAVVKHMGSVDNGKIRTEAGTYFDFWMTETYVKYDVKVQTLDITDSAYSKDAQTMDIQMTVQYSVKATAQDLTNIAKEYGTLDALTSRIRSVAIEKTKGVLSTHKAMNDENDNNGIIENREKVGNEVTEAVKKALDGYYVNVNAVVLTNIDFTDAFEKIVEEKMIAEQEQLKAKYEKEKAIIKAEQDLEVAKRAADAKLYQANQDAEAKKAIALAEAVSISAKIAKLAESLGYKVETIYAERIKTEVVDREDGTKETVEVRDKDGNLVMEKTDVVAGYKITWTAVEGNSVPDNGQELILEYLKYLEYLATWNGELPNVVGDGTGFMITVPSPGTGE